MPTEGDKKVEKKTVSKKKTTKKKGPTQTLVIVESPAKAKTIGKFLGSKYKVVASVGHVRDLPKSKLGIDIEGNYEPQYINIRGKGDIIKLLKKEAKSAKNVLLATDPDREGEAISWHIAYILGINPEDPCRIEFNEITKEAVVNAAKNPRPIDLTRVDAQQGRRVLDRLVGYKISPLLWKKVKPGLSAGRVQSAALKIICDQEKRILAFEKEEYWSIESLLETMEKKSFLVKLIESAGKKVEIHTKEEVDALVADLNKGTYEVDKVEEKEKSRKALPPYTTSTLQQDGSNRLNFQSRRTMSTAQQLYEGIQIKGSGVVGLITYLRTDSVRISSEAKEMAKDYIMNAFSAQYYSNNSYANKKKDAQDAHEAIRPTSVERTPESIKESLTPDQYKLYKLIWERFVASQMAKAVYHSVSVEVKNQDYTLKATGSQIKFEGFMRVYKPNREDDNNLLPPVSVGDTLNCLEVKPEQHFTQPPPRFTDASIIKELEEKGIGRPSTYAPIVSTLVSRTYIKREKKSLVPTKLGFIVTELLEDYFKNIVDVAFTAEMEEKLDHVETSEIKWKAVIDEFYKGFEKELVRAEEEVSKMEVEPVLTDEICELCGKPFAIKEGRFGKFLACSGYPDCKNTKPIIKKVGVACPKCGKDLIQRKSKRGKIFYGCSGYPDCDFVAWNKPTNKKCPECGAMMLENKTKTSEFKCSKCDHKE